MLSIGDTVRIWKPRTAEHGLRGMIRAIDAGYAYPVTGWTAREAGITGPWPLAGLVSEREYQRRRAADPNGGLWND